MTTTISKPKKAAAAQSCEKALPNYLKPTISSSLDFSSSRSFRRGSCEKPPSLTNTRTPRSFLTLSSRSANASISMRRTFSAKASPTNSSSRVTRKGGPRSVTSESSVEFNDHLIAEEDETEEMMLPATTPRENKQQNDPKVDEKHVVENKEHPAVVVEMEEENEANVDEKHVVELEETNEGAPKVKVETPSRPANPTQPYNDVIEITATKLMKKSNKVRALAGAFETVISLQDTTTK